MENDPMIWDVDNVLVLSAHTDDMEVGAGATVRRLVESGAKVKSLVFSDCKKSVDISKYPLDVLRTECRAAADHIGIKDLTILELPVRDFPNHRQEILETIYALRKKDDFDLVLTLWTGDLHQDHKVVAEETFRAFMRTDVSVLSYEVAGSSPGFVPQVFFPLAEDDVERKMEMLSLYRSQVERRGYFTINAVRSVMGYHGHHCGAPYAEAFSLHRGVVCGFGRKAHHS
ncbi:MAG: PIG-L family deacetylase [Candidatus Thorarchaeota archaeon]|nr:PIG-L family deacetylase [Candidatus Thorarchaeota archaeon]